MTAATALVEHVGPASDDVPGVHYVVTGDPHAEQTLVLLHGFADNLSTWARVVAPLAVERRVVAIDLPGFGLSDRRWSAPLCAGYADVVAEVLDALGVTGPVSLVGNSMGAVVAALFAARYPARTTSVALLDPPGLGAPPRLWDLAFSRPAELGLRASDRLVPGPITRTALSTFYAHVAAARPGRLEPAVWREFVEPYAHRKGMAGIAPIGRALLHDLRSIDLPRIIVDLENPTLVLAGARDVLTPARRLRHLASRPGFAHRIAVLPGCGHCPQLDQPAELLAELVPFLRSAAAGPIALEDVRTA